MRLWSNLMIKNKRLKFGGRINREQEVSFSFNGKKYKGFQGDTLASALLANGVMVTARSFKYHRPRGIVGSGIEEPASLVELLGDDESGNNLITSVIIKEGLKARSVNCWPSAEFDFGALIQVFSRFIPAGFYYKTFKWPTWHLFEPFIRKAAGLARAPVAPPKKGHFESRNAHADILIVGAGPSGLIAALVAGRAGARVIIADQNYEPGGSLLDQNLEINGQTGLDWVQDVVSELSSMENVSHLQNSTVWAYREHNLLIINQRVTEEVSIIERSWRVRANQVLIATGAIERSLVFPNNDRPGVMMASAIQAYINRYAVLPGEKVVLFTNNDSAYSVAVDILNAGGHVVAVVDSRKNIPEYATKKVPNVTVFSDSVVAKVNGYKRVKSVQIMSISTKKIVTMSCDLVGHSGGWNPTVHLHSQSRGSLKYVLNLATFVPDKAIQKSFCVGAASGKLTLDEALSSGLEVGKQALKEIGLKESYTEIPNATLEKYSIEPLWQVEASKKFGKSFLDIQNDVTSDDVDLAILEGYSNVEHVKRYTTGGMGIDQGKTGNINIIGKIALSQGLNLEEVGTTTFRSPFSPVSFGSIGGLREGSVVLPYRHTPITKWNLDKGAFMYEAGARWRRPGYFPMMDEGFQDAVNRECLAVRTSVGVYDGSPLGKFELQGKDVSQFLDLIYTNVMSSLKPGNGRYGFMLTDDGLIFDDGVVFRLSEDRWLLSTSSGHSDAVNQHMKKVLKFDQPNWDVKITGITSQWSNATICGPNARKVLEKLGTNIDISKESFPFMSFREGTVGGIAARIIRVSFTGELSFEINVATRDLLKLWNSVLDAGIEFNILPVGSEASHVLRVEKGFLSLGHEVDGTVDAFDLGMGWVMSKKKKDFIGKRSVELRRSLEESRRELVGLLPENPNDAIPEGAPLTPKGEKRATEGLTTACVWSVLNNRWVGLALLENGHSRHGETAYIRLKERAIKAKITAPIFHDPSGELLRS